MTKGIVVGAALLSLACSGSDGGGGGATGGSAGGGGFGAFGAFGGAAGAAGFAGSAGAGLTGGSAGAGGGIGGTPNTSPLVDPNCTDGKYSEVLPNVNADFSGVPFNPGNLNDFYLGVLGVRYPIGKDLVAGGLTSKLISQGCVAAFAGNPSSVSAAIKRIGTVVHECGHIYDLELGKSPNNVYVIRSDAQFTCQRGDSVARGGDTFARSLLNTDSYSALRPPCTGSSSSGCDTYGKIYLNGDPNNGSFEGGDQGYNMLLEEAVQYVNSIATSWAFEDQLSSGSKTSQKDGILTFLWYIARYLKMDREQYPQAYQRISGDACWRDATLTTWGRGWLYLEQTKNIGSLGINDTLIEPLVLDQDLLAEIQRLRDASGCQ